MVLHVWYVPKLPGHRLLSRALILHLTDSPDPQRLAGVDRVRDYWVGLHIYFGIYRCGSIPVYRKWTAARNWLGGGEDDRAWHSEQSQLDASLAPYAALA